MSTAEATIEQVEQEEREPAARTATAAKMFKYSAFLDVGEGAESCERDAETGEVHCDNPLHFHAWCRLPNPYQEQDIRKKSEAAKARRIRALRDPESDLAVILDSELSSVDDPSFRDALIDELIAETWGENYLEAQADVAESEEFEHIEQDKEEYNRLHAVEAELADEEQSDEYKRLRDHIRTYLDAINARRTELERPRREELEQRPFESLLELARNKRIDAEGDRAFVDTFNAWTYYVGTFKTELHPSLRRPHLPTWEQIGHRDRPEVGTMYGESDEVIKALMSTYTELRTSQRNGSGN